MNTLEIFQLASVIISPIFAAGGAYAAVRARLDAHDRQLTAIESAIRDTNTRIDNILTA